MIYFTHGELLLQSSEQILTAVDIIQCRISGGGVQQMEFISSVNHLIFFKKGFIFC
jgi:hypothetical protein